MDEKKPRITFQITIFLFIFLLIFFVLGGNLVQAFTDDSVDVTLKVEKYTTLTYDRDPQDDGLDFLKVKGSTGIYHTNGNSHWENYLTDIWDDGWETHPVHDQDGQRQAIIIMDVRTNTDIVLEFKFEEGENWLESDTLFALWNAPGGYSETTFGKHDNYDITTSFKQPSNTAEEYHLVGGFLIEEITQQIAGNYSADIQVTIFSDD